MTSTVLVTGGAGFIGGCFVRRLAAMKSGPHTINLDKLTYAGNLDSLVGLPPGRSTFIQGDIGDVGLVKDLLERFQPQAIINFAAESHVDRSIDGPLAFVQTNTLGTAVLLDCARHYYHRLTKSRAAEFRFLQVSTDEVYGSLGTLSAFTEESPYRPRSPYSASKAAADHLTRAFFETYGLPVLITNCGNNYGPFQFPEKLVPLMILNALEGKPLPVYGDGANIRDWLFVEDHCAAIEAVLSRGKIGATYNIGANCELTNLNMVKTICKLVDALQPGLPHPCEELITFVQDRPGHDQRYAIDSSKLQRELGWRPTVGIEDGLRRTVQWYIDHREWTERITQGIYQRQRLGRGA